MRIDGRTKLCMIIGDPVGSSLSPLLHNCAYKAAGVADKFIYVAVQVESEKLRDAVRGLRALKVHGVSCTMPHKQQIMKFLDQIDPIAEKIGAVNTVVNRAGKLIGFNTDWLGVIEPLESITTLAGKRAAVLGAGGAARAACFGLTQRGCHVKIFNRTVRRAKKLAEEFECKSGGVKDLLEIPEYDIIFNATPVGMFPAVDHSPLPQEYLRKGQIVFDSIYNPRKTLLLTQAISCQATVISGSEMLLHQAITQFELFTGCNAPIDKMRAELNIAMENK